MKRKLSLLPVVVFGLALMTQTSSAQIPGIISYQGIIPGSPSTTLNVTFSIYTSATGGAPLWSENQNPVTDLNGIWSALIGSTGTAAPLGQVNWAQPLWLEVTVNGGPNPRIPFTTSPYAFEAGEALSVADGTILPEDIADGNTDPTDGQVLAYDAASNTFQWVTAGGGSGSFEVVAGPGIQVTNGTGPVATVAVANQGITSGMIANGAVNTQHIAPGAVASAQIAANGVITQHIGPQQVTLPKINHTGATAGSAIMFDGIQLVYGSPTPGGPAGGDLTGTYPNPVIAPLAVTNGKLAPDAVTTDKILDETITVNDIGPNAVGTSELINESILSDDIATGAVTTTEILDETIQKIDIGNDAVGTEEILNESILSEDIMNGTIETEDIGPGPIWTALVTVPGTPNEVQWTKINSETILDETILADDIATGAVTTDEILDETIMSVDIANGQVMTVDVADGAITNQKLAADAVTTDKILDGEVMNPDVATGAIDSRTILNESIQTQDIQDGQVMNTDLADNSVTTQKIQDGQVMNADIAADAVTTDKIANETIVAADIATGAVTSDEILNGTILTADIGALQITNPLIGNDAVDSRTILNESIVAADIATGGVTTDEILDQTILEEDIAPDAAGGFLQTDGTIVFWGPPAVGSIPVSALMPGPDNTVLTTQPGGVVQWDLVATPMIMDAAVTNPKLATDAVTTDKILNGTIQPIDIMPSATDDWVLKTVAGAVTWAPDGLTLPFQQTDPTSGQWSFEITKTGTSEGVFHGIVNNVANGQAAIMGETDGTGPGVRGEANGAGDGGEFIANGAGNGVTAEANGVGSAVVANAIGTGSAVVATANSSTVVLATASGNNNAVEAVVNGAGDAIQAVNNGGAGRAGVFVNTSAANANDVVVAVSQGPLPAGTAVANIVASNLNGGAGVMSSVSGTGWSGTFSSTGGADGLRIETDDADEAMGLHLERGGMKVSYRTGTAVAGNVAMQDDDVFVIVPDDASLGTTFTVSFPAAPINGQIVWVYNQDEDVLLVPAVDRTGALLLGVGYPISVDRGAAFVFSGDVGGWVPVSNN